MTEPENGRGALATSGIAAVLASACCLAPLALAALGISGAWIGNVAALEPYRPIFAGTALVALFLAHRRMFGSAQVCKPGDACAVPRGRTGRKAIFWVVAALVLVALAFPYIAPSFL